MKPRNAARRREAVQFEFGAKNQKFLFVDVILQEILQNHKLHNKREVVLGFFREF